ncbi:uncharacterized protein LOC124370047 [Homalodisca vitripennis]|uniref:uncharacterized protein LOC124370047 n=1 Tax=Homalodisca vitripennis TaxID=197043 RepID=UPI001EE9DB77|nr:uncharacterized protein LOC124370047 [Homalodisca vitripennis]KAG8301219.1 hypothetical protein J6590_058215 [Homalodisca vitripennis]
MDSMEAGSAPDFLNSEFLTECLRNEWRNQNIIIESYKSSRAAPPGYTFISCPLRVQINFKYHPEDSTIHFISLIVKSEPLEGQIKDVADPIHLSEPVFYSKFVPEINNLISTQLVPKSFFSPRLFTVVLEDLREQGFKNVSKAKMLDLDHSRLYFKTAATLHALSFVVNKNNPSLLETIGKEKIYTNGLDISNIIKSHIRNGLKCLSECTEQIERFKKYIKLLKDAITNLWDLLVEALKPSAVLNTINQGDSWTINMMFKYDEGGNVCDMRLLDFQLLRYGSPVNDLVFFIWSSATHEVRSHGLEELYNLYVETFNNKLRDLNCKETISYEYVRSEERRLSPLALYLVAGMPPFNCENSVSNMEPFLHKENEDEEALNIYRKYYDEQFCSYHVPRYLEQMESVGVFDYLEQCIQLRN